MPYVRRNADGQIDSLHREPSGEVPQFLEDRGFLLPSSRITPRAACERRRGLLKLLAGGAAGATLAGWAGRAAFAQTARPARLAALPGARSAVAGAMTMEKLTPYADVTSYNNYYEFGTDKSDPGRNAHTPKTRPWTVAIEGEVKKPRTFDIDELTKLAPQEERVYRLRCVEGWSMVIPWIGYTLNVLLKQVDPLSSARYVAFQTLLDPKRMPNQNTGVLDWPYVEGLRLDEALHPLTILATGLYGQTLPPQDGAPIRLVVPWKYGFKSIK